MKIAEGESRRVSAVFDNRGDALQNLLEQRMSSK